MAPLMHIALFLTACLTVCGSETVKSVDEYLREIKEFTTKNEGYQNAGNNMEYYPYNNKLNDLPAVDFVVIGVGTGGAIVANRLAENNNFTVMALEAGTYGNVATNVTALSYMLLNSPYNWGYNSIPNKMAALGVKDKIISVPRGKGFGGITMLNGVRYVRNSKHDWDKLVEEGNLGWDYETMLKYFKKSEKSTLETEDEGYHGKSGPQIIEHAKDTYAQSQAAIEGLNELKYKTVDYNGAEQIGVANSQLMSKNGIRYTTAKGFIEPILHKNNIKIVDKAFVMKVDINPITKVAEGVIFSRNKMLYRVHVKKEIILCAGAINSPQILQLSGVGPRADLERLKIRVIQDLPVGRNLTDHPLIFVAHVNFPNDSLPEKTLREHLQDFVRGHGELTVGTGMRAISLQKTKYAQADEEADITPSYKIPTTYNKVNKNTSSYMPKVFDSVYDDVDLNSALNIAFMITNPKSRGSVTLNSSSPYDHPIIDLNLLSDARDVLVAVEGTNMMMSLINSKTFKEYGAIKARNVFPACKNFQFANNLYYTCAVRQVTSGGMHIFNTCRMGQNPSDSVVDHHLKVHGIKNLRVADASILSYVNGWPMAVVMAVAEKASDMIKLEHGFKQCVH